jgi:hypothetical protein
MRPQPPLASSIVNKINFVFVYERPLEYWADDKRGTFIQDQEATQVKYFYLVSALILSLFYFQVLK